MAEKKPGLVARWKRWRIENPELLSGLEAEQLPRQIPDRRAKYDWLDRPAPQITEENRRHNRRVYIIIGILTCSILMFLMMMTVLSLPRVGDPESPVMNEVVDRYVENGMEETHAVNVIASIILYFRAFDTLGEAHVLFAALACVMLLLEIAPKSERSREKRLEDILVWGPQGDPVMREVTRILFPTATIFGLYVILNGHLSPGGGFSGGTIIGACLILHAMAYGGEKTRLFFSERVFIIVKVSTLLLYSVIMIAFFIAGANALGWNVPLGHIGDIFSSGHILVVNIAVGFEVACTMYGMYSMFERGHI